MSANCSVKNYLQNINTEKQKGHYSCDCCRIWSNVKCIVLKRWDHLKTLSGVNKSFQLFSNGPYVFLHLLGLPGGNDVWNLVCFWGHCPSAQEIVPDRVSSRHYLPNQITCIFMSVCVGVVWCMQGVQWIRESVDTKCLPDTTIYMLISFSYQCRYFSITQ